MEPRLGKDNDAMDVPADVLSVLRDRGLLLSEPERMHLLQGGRTNLLWRFTGADAASDLVLKLYRGSGPNPLFPNEIAAEVAALTALAAPGLCPRRIDHGQAPSGDWIVYDRIDGDLWRRDTASVARALHRVHDQPPWPSLRITPHGSAALSQQTEAILAKCPREDQDRLLPLRPDQVVAPCSVLTVIHADPVPGNIVVRDGTTVFIDWQCPALGDPAEDLAIFLSPAMQLLYRGQVLGTDDIAACLAAYPARDVVDRYHRLAPWYHWRMVAYCAWRRAQGQTDYAKAMIPELQMLSALSHP
ncbi:MAG: aminoglycoside phosphotransferase family protein [Rhodobacteraceae bacterium]|nr:aminoglycoside phosphotransferase family protein [Paracoccaceae bacterium]